MQRRSGHSANGHDGFRANGNGKTSLPIDWEHLARATAHPLRISIMEILGMDGGRTLSPSDLSQELQIPLSNTNYHVTELAKARLIELARERQVRGATEHF
jgi:DNA-binding transcriptional ArsR family regulator